MKDYPLEVCELHDLDSGETMSFYSKGHHPAADFIGEALREYEVIIKVADVRLLYMRWGIVSGPDGPGHIGFTYNSPGRGRFPVTICDDWENA